MSGTSLDGIDIAFCRFQEMKGKWDFQILNAETIEYTGNWKNRLSTLSEADAEKFVATDIDYGLLLGKVTNDFIKKNNIDADFICSHGHTIFHQPSKHFTVQIGNGSAISALSGHTVVCDFRQLDVSLGGQGAPLVSIGDRLLFGEYDYCLNLGGFSNISFEKEGNRIAFDICPANIILNFLAEKAGFKFDKSGSLAKSGNICFELLETLNNLEYYSLGPPKSLGKEWVISHFLPALAKYNISIEDKLRTVNEHIVIQISRVVQSSSKSKVFVSGGGVYNTFLLKSLEEKTKSIIVIPEPGIVEFKEAMIFAFLGTLRMRNEINCLCSVTGAIHDSCGGVIFSGLPPNKLKAL